MNTTSRSPESASIQFLTGPLTGSVFSITEPTISIGRDTSNDIVIKDDPHVSPYHVCLLWKEVAWYIEKHPQASEVSVNQQNVDHAMLSDSLVSRSWIIARSA